MLSGVRALLFDLDGTLVATDEIIQRAMLDTLAHCTGRPWERPALMPHWGMRLRDQLRALCPELDLDAAVPYYRARYAIYHEALLAEIPGTRAMLDAVRARGVRLGVVTSKKRQNARQTLRDVGFLALFDVVVAEEDTTRHKPAPEPLLYALTSLNHAPDVAAYVGDNPDDVRAARAAGMRAVAVSWGFRGREEIVAVGPDLILDAPAELLPHLSSP
ncbi:MAG TPA: HAD-IA family hydrolase [Armatimonadota bacterium]|nr:HAD-IA family hydrolase [Armatimonadota bacterium]HOS42558.1 HAD-IA family hydrolase [Armatimonadota bacterium]